MITSPDVAEKAAALRLAFDRTFAEPARIEADSRDALLSVLIGNEHFAIRLSDISGLHVGKKITPVPGGHPALIGIAGFRGAILPVYRLQILLGAVVSANTPPPRWLVIAAAAPVALAFEGFEGQRRVPHDAIVPQPALSRPYTREFVRSRKVAAAILHLPSLIETIDAAQIETT
jgi:purine-binding chemotaxis protein CheW